MTDHAAAYLRRHATSKIITATDVADLHAAADHLDTLTRDLADARRERDEARRWAEAAAADENANAADLRATREAVAAIHDALGNGADETVWPSGLTAAEAVAKLCATLDAVAALVGGGDVVERVRALLPVERERPTTTYRIRIGRNAPISEWIACCSRLGDGASYAVALLECVGEGIMPEQLTESVEAVTDLREHMGDLITITEHPYTDECPF